MKKHVVAVVLGALLSLPLSSNAQGSERSDEHGETPTAPCTGAVHGTAFIDANANGVQNPGELPLPGATVTLTRTGNGLPAFGSLQRTSNFTTMTNNAVYNGRGIAYDGVNYWITSAGQSFVLRLKASNLAVLNSYATAPWTAQALTWDERRHRIWAIGAKLNSNHTDYVWRIWGINPATGAEIPGSTVPVPSELNNPDGVQYDGRTDTFWSSNDGAIIAYHVNMAGAVIGSFSTPFWPPYRNSGIGFDGCHLWLALIDMNVPTTSRFVMVSDTGSPLASFDYFQTQPTWFWAEDVEIDARSAAPDILLWSQSGGAAPGRLRAWSIARTVQTTKTDAQGKYVFSDVAPGQYIVKQSPATGYAFTLPSGGTRSVTVTNTIVAHQNFGNK